MGGFSIYGVARLIVLWTDPMHLSAEEAERWVREESGRLLALDGIERLGLARLDRVSDAHARPWDWLLEVHLLPGADGVECVEAPLFADWLRDLRLLGMRPVALSVSQTTAIAGDRA